MSLPVVISLRAEHDLTLQYRWYLENADEETAERYLKAVWLHRGFNSGASCDAMPSFPAMAKVTHPPEPEFAFLDSDRAAYLWVQLPQTDPVSWWTGTSKISAATRVEFLPPEKPTSHGRGSSRYKEWRDPVSLESTPGRVVFQKLYQGDPLGKLQARIPCTTLPDTSVRRKSRPW